MGNLILNSLEIRGFRGFRHLQIERLGRVNLIVGKNNVGKSSLLEALQLYAVKGSPAVIWELLRIRDESRYSSEVRDERRYTSFNRSASIEDRLLALKYLFYGRKDVRTQLEPIRIGPVNTLDELLSIAIGWYVREIDEQSTIKRRLLEPEEYDTVDNPTPRFTIQVGTEPKVDYPLSLSTPPRLVRSELTEINLIFRSASGLTREEVGSLWDSISLTSLEKDVLAALRIIAPGVEGLSLVGDPGSSAGRIPIVRIMGIDEPLPLRSLGDGMQRMLGIALALANAQDGMLLVDEVENGIHYSVQPELWQLVFRLAHRLNIQVFATTHSWDCIEGFQKAAQEDKQNEGLLIRLESKKDDISVTLFDERRLAIATREQIEVR
jgi:AAA domain, putative AbiEii toxin, Type IV TA system